MKKLVKRFFWVIFLLVLPIFLYWLIATISKYIVINRDFQSPSEGEGVTIFVVSNGVHTDIAVPTEHSLMNWHSFLNDEKSKDSEYTGFGWGDKGFYLNTPNWSDLKFSTAFKAMFWKSATAMHVTYSSKRLEEGEYVKKIVISEKQYKILIGYIKQSFILKNGQPMLIKDEAYPGVPNSFFEAQGSYHFLKTCNEWTRTGLAQSGVKTIFWSPFADCLVK